MYTHASTSSLRVSDLLEASPADVALTFANQLTQIHLEYASLASKYRDLAALLNVSKLVTVKVAARRLNLSQSAVYRAVSRGSLIATRIDGGPIVLTELSIASYRGRAKRSR